MKKKFLILMLAWSFFTGFALNLSLAKINKTQKKMAKVTGIGGIFFKSQDPEKTREWYKNHLGMDVSPYGAKFDWKDAEDTTKSGYTLWTPFAEKTTYFEPSTKDFMINYRVENIEVLVEELKKQGVTILDTIANYEYGKFVHILDPEGNKIELFEAAEGH